MQNNTAPMPLSFVKTENSWILSGSILTFWKPLNPPPLRENYVLTTRVRRIEFSLLVRSNFQGCPSPFLVQGFDLGRLAQLS